MLYRIDYLNGEGRFRLVVADDMDSAMRIAGSQLAEREEAQGNPDGFQTIQGALDDQFFLILPATPEDEAMVAEQGAVPPLTAEQVSQVLPFDLTGLRRGGDRYKALEEQTLFMLLGLRVEDLDEEVERLADLSEVPGA